jgi:hypothetical protein
MADLATILNDPNYVNANPATKAAIFLKFAPDDPNYTNANEATKQAIHEKFGVQNLGKQISESIDTAMGSAQSSEIPAPRAEEQGLLSSFGSSVASLADTTLGAAGPMLGYISQASVRPVASATEAQRFGQQVTEIFDKPFGKLFGVTDTPAYKAELSQRVMNFIGENVSKGADWIYQNQKSIGLNLPKADIEHMMTSLSFLAPRVVATAAPVVKTGIVDAATAARQSPIGQMIEQPIQARNALITKQKSMQSYQNAPRIDAAKDALDLGISLNPAVSNPTTANKLRVATVGSDTINTKLAQSNQGKFTAAAKDDLGLPQTTTLNAKAFEQARNRTELSAPYTAVKDLKNVMPDEGTLAGLESARVQPLVGDTGQAAVANKILDAAKEHLTQGVDGKTLLNSIRARRQEAQAIYRQRDAGVNPPSPEAIAKADMNIAIANGMENMIETHIGANPKLLADFRNARTAMAKTYDYERATNFATGQLDPQVIAKMAAEGKPMTGTLAKIGNVASNYPEVSKGGVLNQPTWRETLPRSGAAGTIGGILGSSFGLAGAIAGGATGAAIGNVASGAMARSMTKPSFQAAKAMPPDFRQPIVNNLQPGKNTNNLR